MDFSFTKPLPINDDDVCSNVSTVIGKPVESIVDFYGAPSKKKKYNYSGDEESETEEIDDYPEDEDLLDLIEGIDNKVDKHLQIERFFNDQETLKVKHKPDETLDSYYKVTLDDAGNAIKFEKPLKSMDDIFVDLTESDYENKMAALRKKLAKTMKKHEESMKAGERKLRACFESGRYKKVEGIEGFYVDTYIAVKELEICATETDKDVATAENMDLTLTDDDAPVEDMHDAEGNIDDSDPETAEEESILDKTLEEPHLADNEASDMELTSGQPNEVEADATSIASDLDFPVPQDLRQLQKEINMPNDVLRLLCQIYEEADLKEDDAERDENVEDELEEGDEEAEEEEEENDKGDNEDAASTTTGSILSEIQNITAATTDQSPPPPTVVAQPTTEEDEKKIILANIGIPQEDLHKYRIVWIPTEVIVDHYKQIDRHLYSIAFNPDGTRRMSNDQALKVLMERQVEQNNNIENFPIVTSQPPDQGDTN